MRSLIISGSYITLGQLLKRLDFVQSGGHVKVFLQERRVKVNGVIEERRGRKIYPQDIVQVEGHESVQIRQ